MTQLPRTHASGGHLSALQHLIEENPDLVGILNELIVLKVSLSLWRIATCLTNIYIIVIEGN